MNNMKTKITIPFTITLESIKYLGINLIKVLKDLYIPTSTQ